MQASQAASVHGRCPALHAASVHAGCPASRSILRCSPCPCLQGATAMAMRDFPTILQDCEPTGDIKLQCGSQYDATTFFVAFVAKCASGNVTLQVGGARGASQTWRVGRCIVPGNRPAVAACRRWRDRPHGGACLLAQVGRYPQAAWSDPAHPDALQGWGTGEGTTPGPAGQFFSFAGPLV